VAWSAAIGGDGAGATLLDRELQLVTPGTSFESLGASSSRRPRVRVTSMASMAFKASAGCATGQYQFEFSRRVQYPIAT
jgi:hypothetical protein